MRVIKRPTTSITISLIVVLCLYYFLSVSSTLEEPKPLTPDHKASDIVNKNEQLNEDTVEIPFMPKMANETIK